MLVARRDGRVLGTVMAGADGHRGWVYHLAVAPVAQGGGLGAALLRAAEDRLAAAGARKIQLMVRTDHPVSGFHAAHGYTEQACTVLGRWPEPTA